MCTASRSDVKLHHESKAVNLDRCSEIYAIANITLNSKHICAGGEDKDDTCTGDSGDKDIFQIISWTKFNTHNLKLGGPIMAESRNISNRYAYLVGVESFGPRVCGKPGWPEVYMVK